jgi:hypothetical protein
VETFELYQQFMGFSGPADKAKLSPTPTPTFFLKEV